jgi:predicted metal-dependent enzyme (double-stranded beta helix superfamily)
MDSGLLCETFPGADELMDRLCSAVALGQVHDTAEAVRETLKDLLGNRRVRLPERFLRPVPEHYARRLLYRCPEGRFTAVVMAWGPGQKTPLHDHAGIWCVEGVVCGSMRVERYDLLEEGEGLYRFEKVEEMAAGVGDSGCLIPPYEYHILGNDSSEDTSITLHVYGGEMDHCCIFEPTDRGGWYRRVEKELAYTQD